MSFARARVIRGLQSTFRSSSARAVPRVSAPSRTQLAVGRRYASGGGGHAEPSSDLPWLIGAIVVTVPSCYFLWPTSHAEHGHAEGHGEHEEAHEEEAPQEDTAPGEEAPKEESESTQEQAEEKDAEANKPEEAKEDEQTAKPSGSEGESQPKAPDANKESAPPEAEEDQGAKEGGGKVEGVQFKGKMKEDAPGQDDTRKREADSKGAYKKRIDSGLQKELGGGPQQLDDPEGESPRKESSQTAKPPLKGSEGDITGKQFGLSNTPTRHSHQIDQDPEKSKKPEGPETAKVMGPVDPNRPAT